MRPIGVVLAAPCSLGPRRLRSPSAVVPLPPLQLNLEEDPSGAECAAGHEHGVRRNLAKSRRNILVNSLARWAGGKFIGKWSMTVTSGARNAP